MTVVCRQFLYSGVPKGDSYTRLVFVRQGGFGMRDWKNLHIERQMSTKYENKKRKAEEQKSARINLRVREESKKELEKLAESSGISQSDVFEQLLAKGHVKGVLGGVELARNLCNLTDRLCWLEKALEVNNQKGSLDKIYESLNSVENDFREIKRILLDSFKGDNNGNLKN